MEVSSSCQPALLADQFVADPRGSLIRASPEEKDHPFQRLVSNP
jgi:hypothetical protein